MKNTVLITRVQTSQIKEEIVECINFNDLVHQEKINKIDLLQIDTEGYDFEIIYSIDFLFIIKLSS